MSSEVPVDLKYANTHEWMRVEEGTVTVGVTDHAQAELTDVVFVELPEVGRVLAAGEACAVVESVKSASDINTPVAGKVMEANSALADTPSLVNDEPYGGGWFFKMKMEGDLPVALMDAGQYRAEIGG